MADAYHSEFGHAGETRSRPKLRGASPEPAGTPKTYPWKDHGKPRKVHKAHGKKVKTAMAGNC